MKPHMNQQEILSVLSDYADVIRVTEDGIEFDINGTKGRASLQWVVGIPGDTWCTAEPDGSRSAVGVLAEWLYWAELFARRCTVDVTQESVQPAPLNKAA